MMKYSKALKALIHKAEKETEKLLSDVTAGKLDKGTLKSGLQQVGEDLKLMNVFNHRADADEES